MAADTAICEITIHQKVVKSQSGVRHREKMFLADLGLQNIASMNS